MVVELDLLELSSLRPPGPMPAVTPDEVDLTAKVGVYPPLMVRPLSYTHPRRYEILKGEKSWRLAQMAGLGAAPVIVRDDITDEDARALLEEERGEQRKGEDPLTQARAIQRIKDERGCTLTEAAAILGMTLEGASHRLRLLRLDSAVQELLARGRLRLGHAKPLVGLPAELQRVLATRAVREHLSARALERLARTARGGGSIIGETSEAADTCSPEKDPDLVRLATELSVLVGSPVTIEHRNDGGGTLRLSYANLDVLDGLLDRLGYSDGA